jgi:hypothetical protein
MPANLAGRFKDYPAIPEFREFVRFEDSPGSESIDAQRAQAIGAPQVGTGKRQARMSPRLRVLAETLAQVSLLIVFPQRRRAALLGSDIISLN